MWMTEGSTLLSTKDVMKGSVASNYRPYCLPVVCKLLIAMIAEDIYAHLVENRLFPDEQKGCKKCTLGTKD